MPFVNYYDGVIHSIINRKRTPYGVLQAVKLVLVFCDYTFLNLG